MKNKSVLKEIIRFLEFLEKNDQKEKDRNMLLIYGAKHFDNRTIKLCQEGNYIEKHGDSHCTITIKGIEFLEKHKEIKAQKGTQNSQIFLTFALFTAAFFQGIILMAYYHFDLKSKGAIYEAWILGGAGIIMLMLILLIFFKFKKILYPNVK